MNPIVIRWARETAGLSLEEAAEALNLSSPDRLEIIESGEKPASRAQLLRMSKLYRRSLLTFYLPSPPRKGDRGHDFRTLPADRPAGEEARVDALVRDVRARQDMVRSILEDEEIEPLQFIGSHSHQDSVSTVARAICETLAIDLATYRGLRTAEDGFGYLRIKAEAVGVFVLLIGNLGTHHTAISVEAFRGFAIADSLAPFVVINDQDAKTAWSFTLLHELAHLWLGQTGVSGAYAEMEIEKFCNDVASNILLPRVELEELHVADGMSTDEAIALISEFSSARHISRKMAAYTLFRVGKIQFSTWKKLDQEIHSLWLKERERSKAQSRESDASGPSYYVVKRHRLGKALLRLIDRTLSAGNLTPVKAAKVLGVKPRSVQPLLVEIHASRFGGGA